jgi:lipopolysaccharide assembly protein A
MQFFLVLALIIAIVAVVFALQNTALVTLTFFLWSFQGSLALLVLVALAVGALVGILVSLPGLVKNSWTSASQKKKITTLQTSLDDYRAKLDEAQRKVAELQQPAPSAAPAPVMPPAAGNGDTSRTAK